MQNQTPARKFYFLTACQVVFAVQNEGEEVQMSSAFINGVVTNDKDVFPSRLVGKAQQIAQMHLFKRLGQEASKNVNVVDVVVMSVTNLGYMTEEEFQAAPEGMKQQETKRPELSIVAAPAVDPLEAAVAAATDAMA